MELFDRSWHGSSPQDVLSGLRHRQEHISPSSWLAAYHHVLVDGWDLFVQAGGRFAFPRQDVHLLTGLLADGPYLVVLSSTYLNNAPKKRYNKSTDRFDSDAVAGRSVTHAVTCAGYRDDTFVLIDPEPPAGQPHRREIERDHLVAAIMAAQTESDNLLLTVRARLSR